MLASPLMVNSHSVVFNVGEAAGWSAQSGVNYTRWTIYPTFLVGDSVRFVYNPTTTNVLEVTFSDKESCNSTSPIATYNTGNDTILLPGIGHRYFISGNPVECNMINGYGLKLDIQVRNVSQWREERSCPYCNNNEVVHKPQCCACPYCDDPLLPRRQCCDQNTSIGGATTTTTTSPTSTSAGRAPALTPTTSPDSISAGGIASLTPTMSPISTSAKGEAKTRAPNSTTSAASKFSINVAGLVRFIC
ncbi:hypothetical protein MKW94_016738 [Papaver nudicaule]|uniref:Phytocyanin domain-containing protein n=1 Tax=Papaver nudicaule TaxID=74823 RepID=A0AA41V9U3_PAPNU|nr:hypothetical protein [Papaver nudicaule]